jgi:hypothetical protein
MKIELDFNRQGDCCEIDPYFYLGFIRTLRNPELPEQMLKRPSALERFWHADLVVLEEAGCLEDRRITERGLKILEALKPIFEKLIQLDAPRNVGETLEAVYLSLQLGDSVYASKIAQNGFLPKHIVEKINGKTHQAKSLRAIGLRIDFLSPMGRVGIPLEALAEMGPAFSKKEVVKALFRSPLNGTSTTAAKILNSWKPEDCGDILEKFIKIRWLELESGQGWSREGESKDEGISNDFVLTFAQRALFQFSFDISEGAEEILLKVFQKQTVRLHRWHGGGEVVLQQAVLQFGPSLFAHVRGGAAACVHVYASTAARAEALEMRLRKAVPTPIKRPDEPFFYMLRKDGVDISTERVLNISANLDDEDMRLCYGADSLGWLDNFATLTKKPGGISILDGPPGTGKSTSIAQLMRRLYKTHVFYVLSVSQHEALHHEGMVEFWQSQGRRHPNEVKVIIMEDAEKILLQRRSDNNEAVSALLNIADGLIGQMLRVHVLCTLNQGMEYLDPAILRPGRLRSYRFVGLLSRSEAEKLAAKSNVHFEPDGKKDQFTLAEIFHGPAYSQEPKRMVGFQAAPAY